MFTDDSSDGGSSFDLTSIIDTGINAAAASYAVSQASSTPQYIPGQNRYGTAVALNQGSSNNTLLILVLAVVAVFAFITFGRR